MYAAIECADLLLDKNLLIGEIKQNNKKTVYKSLQSPTDRDSKIFIWQDNYTASAAEIFIAALTQNRRAISIGTRSFGKGVAQKIIELLDGSALILTYGQIITPNGMNYHDEGLPPDIPIKADFQDSPNAYINQVMTFHR